ncbi:MAG TPA: cytochrome C assembly protein, partial [Burkholderiaceae bacterium]|nr:cytochrome C assembly protein [Burkholderiaceae bacterium]
MSAATASGALAAASAVALLSYAVVALRAQSHANRLHPLLPLAFAAHMVALLVDIAGLGLAQPGARFGFAPALSMTAWLILAVYLVESRLLPLPQLRRGLSLLAAAAVALAWTFPGESRPAASPWAPLHWVLGLASYGLFGVAVLHAALLNRAERQMRQMGQHKGQGLTLGLPVQAHDRPRFELLLIDPSAV